MNDKSKKVLSESGRTVGQYAVNQLERAAEGRGHGGRTKGAMAGALIGAGLLSFVGVVPAGVGALVCCLIGGAIGEESDKNA